MKIYGWQELSVTENTILCFEENDDDVVITNTTTGEVESDEGRFFTTYKEAKRIALRIFREKKEKYATAIREIKEASEPLDMT